MKKRTFILVLALLLVACTESPKEKPEENFQNAEESERSIRQESTEKNATEKEEKNETKNDIAEGMQLLKFSESESLKVQSDFNRFFGSGKVLHDGRIYFSRIKFSVFGGQDDKVGELYTMREDGSELTKLSDDAATCLTVAGDYLYYVNLSEDHTLYRMKLDGSEREKLNDYRMDEFVVDGDRIFFIGEDGSRVSDAFAMHSTQYFGRIKTDGSEYRIISKGDIAYLSTDGKNLYAHHVLSTGNSYQSKVLYYPLEDLRTTTEPEKLKPTPIKDADLPYAVLNDGFVITADMPESDFYQNIPYWIEIKGKDGSVKKVKELRFEDGFRNIHDGKIYTVRIKNWHETEEEENIDIEKALYEIDENGEREIFSYKNDEWTLNEMVGSHFFCRHSTTDDLYLLNTETGEMKQILEALSPSKKK